MKSVILSIIFLLLASVKTAAQKLDEVRWQVDNLISSFPGMVFRQSSIIQVRLGHYERM